MDEFDLIAFGDEQQAELGYNDGLKHGIKVGKIEGFSLGIQRGRDVAKEVAFYSGFCEVFHRILNFSSTKQKVNVEKAQAKLSKILDTIQKISIMSVENESYSDMVSDVRSNFKLLSSMLNVNVSYPSQKPSVSY